jgi:integrase
MEEHGLIDKMPFSKKTILPKKKKDCSAELIPPDQLKPLLDDIRKDDKQLFLACLIEYYCFIRPGRELRLIKGENFDLNNGTIRIASSVAKNGRQRIVTMPTQLIEACSDYGIGKTDPSLYVFGKNKGFDTTPVSVNMLRYRFNQFRDAHKLSKGIKLYSMKHTGATTLHNSKVVSMIELMGQLGHHNLTATQHYLKKRTGLVNAEIRNNFPSPI